MQTSLTAESTWYFIAQDPETGIPPRIAITPPFRIGRREGFDLCLSCRNVSGLHAELLHEFGQLWIEDLNSTNGTFVNGARIRKRASLKDGDSVQFGQSVFTVACLGDDNESPGEDFDSPVVATPVPETTEERFDRLLLDGVVPFFQPIYNITGDSRQRIGYEVLGRSRLFGLKTPDQMFAIATDLEKESELSRTLRLRGIEAAESSFPSDKMLFVNTHPAEMDCLEIQESLKQIRSRFDSRPIMLELPERVLYTPDDFEQIVNVVKDLGVQLVFHDFGAGQIRLAELAAMAPDVVKFDCALLHEIDKADEKRHRLVSAMVKMATELGITPMAEYVETEAEHETLKQLGFELVQGFYYGHPAAIEDLVESVDLIDSAQTAADANKGPDERPIEILGTAQRVEDQIQTDAEPDAKVEKDQPFAEETLPFVPEYEDEQWLLDTDDNRYTLQLMFGPTRKAAEKFLLEHRLPGDYAIYRKWSSNREWHVVVFGIYTNRSEATEAIAQFQNTGHSTWVRDLPSVKEEIRSIDNVATEDDQ